MRAPFAFLKFAAKAIGNAFGAGISGDLLVEVLPEIAKDIWAWWSVDHNAERRRQEIESIAQAGLQEIREQVAEVVGDLAPQTPGEVRQEISIYLLQIPASIRRSLRRRSDPTGKTVSADLVPQKAEDLLRILPTKLTRFQAGGSPLPGVDWQLEELLGVGGFGEVWKARNPHLSSAPPVALKFCVDKQAARVLRNEAAVLDRVMRQGRHSGIVQLHHTYLSAETPCLEYEYVEGGDLTGLMREWHGSEKNCKPEETVKVMYQLALIVGAAHKSTPPIVHRDLKPANILVEHAGEDNLRLKVADFGIGGTAMNHAIRETTLGMSRGRFLASAVHGACTPLYASPQQMRGEPPDPRDDVFVLGVVWYQLLTGDMHSGRPGGSRWRTKLSDRGVSSDLSDLLEACFEDNPEDRPSDAAVLAERLKSILEQSASVYLAEGKAHCEGDEFDEAIKDFSRAISVNNQNEMAYIGRGKAYLGNGDYERAIADFNEAIHLNHHCVEAFTCRGLAYFKQGYADKAIADYTEAIRLDPQYADAYCKLGFVYFERKDYDRAIGNYHAAIRFDSFHPETLYNMGKLYMRQEENEKAIECLNDAIRANPDYIEAYLLRGDIYTEDYKYAGLAIDDYSKVITLKPNCSKAYYKRGKIKIAKGNYDGAIQDITESIRLDPTKTSHQGLADAIYSRGKYRFKKGEYEEAIVAFTKAIELNPNAAHYFSSRGAAYKKMEELERAIADYSEAISLEDDVSDYYFYRGNLYMKRGEFEKAVADYSEAIDSLIRDFEDNDYYYCCTIDYYLRRASAYEKMSDYIKASFDFSEAVALDSTERKDYDSVIDVDYLSDRAKYYVKIGQYKAAIALFYALDEMSDSNLVSLANDYIPGDYCYANALYTKALAVDYSELTSSCSEQANYYWERGQLGMNLGYYDNALNDFNSAINFGLEEPELYCSRGILIAKREGYEQAIFDFDKAIMFDFENVEACKNRALAYRALGDISKALEDEQFAQSLEQK